MRFSIVTPSFRSSLWLKLCIPSVADQTVELEHIVQDSCSDDGTLDWLERDSRVKASIEKDKGMYDAVNRGLRKANGEILCYLNCDEQYLPGALERVGKFFQDNPGIELLFADSIVVNPKGEFLCHRKALLPNTPHSMVSNNLSILTCATFFRRSLIEKRGLFFESKLRDVGDIEWILRCLKQKVPMALLKEFTSAFTDTGENMNLKPNAQREKAELFQNASWWNRTFKDVVVAHHRVRKLIAGGYRQKPFTYSIYTLNSPSLRRSFKVTRPAARWIRPAPNPSAS